MKTLAYLVKITAFLLCCGQVTASELKPIHFGTVNWAPVYSEELEAGGVFTALTREAFKRAGYDYQIEFMNWNRSMALTKACKIDGTQGAYKNDERVESYLYTDAVMEMNIYFFQRTGGDIEYNGMESLKDYSIGIIRGWGYPEVFTNADYLKKDETETPESNVLKLIKGRVDLILGAEFEILDCLNKEFPDEVESIERVKPAVASDALYNIVSKDHPEAQKIVEAFNEGLKAIREDGTYDAIVKQYGF